MRFVYRPTLAARVVLSIGMSAGTCVQLSGAKNREEPPISDRNPQVVKRVIVGYLGLREQIPSDQSGVYFGFSVMELLKLFDDWNQPDAIETIASLSSYYLGASGGELYSCVVVRKGRSILPALEQQSTAAVSDCQQQFGTGKGVCLSDKDFRAHVRNLINRISSGGVCSSLES